MTTPPPPFFPALTVLFETSLSGGDSVPIDPFLLACDEMVKIFDNLGRAFTLVKADMTGNIAKLRKRQNEDPAKFTSLLAIVEEDIKNKNTLNTSSATCAMLWLKRALEYIVIFLGLVSGGNPPELPKCAQAAYDQTLSRVHGMLTRGAFNLALRLAPSRSDFVASFGPDPAAVESQMKAFLPVFGAQVKIIVDMFNSRSLENDIKV